MLLVKCDFRPVLPYVLGGLLCLLSQATHAPSFWQGCLCELQVITQTIKHRLWTKSVRGVGCYHSFIGQSETPKLAGRKSLKRLTLSLPCVLYLHRESYGAVEAYHTEHQTSHKQSLWFFTLIQCSVTLDN